LRRLAGRFRITETPTSVQVVVLPGIDSCSRRGAKDAPKYKDYILPVVFTKRLCDAEIHLGNDGMAEKLSAILGNRWYKKVLIALHRLLPKEKTISRL
jgi:hypothetical protein